MINVNLDIKNKIKETTKGMLLEIGFNFHKKSWYYFSFKIKSNIFISGVIFCE